MPVPSRFQAPFHGLTAINVIALGQLVSLIGTGMSSFALTIWVWQQTHQAMDIALLATCSFAPLFLLTPLAGALVDRWNRKLVMMVSDLASAVATMLILTLLLLDRLEMVSLLIIIAFSGAFRAFQVPAYGAAVTTMVEKKHYARSSGILSLPTSSSLVVAPLLGGALLSLVGLEAVLLLDIVTFLVATATLLLIHVPAPPPSQAGADAGKGLGREMLFGWSYIRRRPPLLKLLLLLFCFNFTLMLSIVLLPPLILARTGNDEWTLGLVQSLIGLGGLVGAMSLSLRGGPRLNMDGLLLGILSVSLLHGVMMGFARNIPSWLAAGFLGGLMLPVITGCAQAIWQAKVPADIQGRVFAMRRLLSQVSTIPAFIFAGPLADRIFEPRMAVGGAWTPWFGPWVGTGPGSGISLIFIVTGLLGMLLSLSALAAGLRHTEAQLPDH